METSPRPSAELVLRLDRPGPRYTSYPTADRFHTGFTAADFEAALDRTNAAPDRPLSVYVHLPHCARICSYCACNVVGTKSQTKRIAYVDDLLSELALIAARLPARRTLGQLHFGGGTPNSYTTADLARLVAAITTRFAPTADAELAIEVDPRWATLEQLQALRATGLNRVSLGVQDIDPDVQHAIGRFQSAEVTRNAIRYARAAGFASVNMDLVYGLPRQTPESFELTLDLLLDERPDRVALFSFAYLPETKPNQRKIDSAHLAAPAAKVGFLIRARERLLSAGYIAIGMDHFALPSDALATAAADGRLRRNFQGYTVAPSGLGDARIEMIGLGLTAISDFGGVYAQGAREPEDYAAQLAAARFPIARGYALTDDDQVRRQLIERMMTTARIPRHDLPAGFERELGRLAPLEDEGLVAVTPEAITLTPLGELFPRLAAMAFDAYFGVPLADKKTMPQFSRVV